MTTTTRTWTTKLSALLLSTCLALALAAPATATARNAVPGETPYRTGTSSANPFATGLARPAAQPPDAPGALPYGPHGWSFWLRWMHMLRAR